MHLTFTPALCEATTISLPISSRDESHLVRFKATFDSPLERDQARRNGVRVEMWTNLAIVGGPTDGTWHSLTFDDPQDLNDGTSYSELPKNTTSFLTLGDQERHQDATSIHLDVHVPLSIFSSHGKPKFSFTYRLVHSSGRVEWLGAFRHDGFILFDRRDSRVTFTGRGHVFATDGGYALESEESSATGVGRLNSNLAWERWSFNGKGPNFSRSHITSPSGCIVLTPSPSPGAHAFVPHALQPMILTVGQAGSSLSVSESGDITFHPASEAPYNPAGFTPLGSHMLAIGRDSTVLDYDSTSDTVVVTSTTPSRDGQASPVALSFIPLGPRSERKSHIDVQVDSRKLAGVFPGSDLVLFQKSRTASRFKVIPTSGGVDDFVTARVKLSGDQICVAPVHDLSIVPQRAGSKAKAIDIWQLGVVSPYTSAQVVSEVHNISSVFPTPPPSPPLRPHGLDAPTDNPRPPEAAIPKEDTLERPTEQDPPSPSDDLEVTAINSHDTSTTTAAPPLTPAYALLGLAVGSLLTVLLGHMYGFLATFFGFSGFKVKTIGYVDNLKEELGDNERRVEPDVSPEIVDVDEDISSDHEEGLSEATIIDSDVETSHLDATPRMPSSLVTISSHLAINLLPEPSLLSFLVRAPIGTDEQAFHNRVQISVGGATPPKLTWTPLKCDALPTYLAELHSDMLLDNEIKIVINA